jgi:quinol monooxygenase YgiN
MLSIVATIKVKEDKVEEAKAFFKQLAAAVAAEEPGTLAYVLHQRKDDPTTFVAYEKYESGEALKTHSDHVAAKAADLTEMLAGPPELIFLDEF